MSTVNTTTYRVLESCVAYYPKSAQSAFVLLLAAETLHVDVFACHLLAHIDECEPEMRDLVRIHLRVLSRVRNVADRLYVRR